MLPPAALGERYAGIEVPLLSPRPYIAGMQFRCADLGVVAACLEQGGIGHVGADGAIGIAPEAAFGAAVEFVEA